ASLVSTTAPGTWTTVSPNTQSNSNGCTGGGDGWICDSDGTSAKADGSTYKWVFNITIQTGDLLTTGDSVKAQYNTSSGGNAGLTSASITLQNTPTSTPEASATALLGMALFVVGILARKRLFVQS